MDNTTICELRHFFSKLTAYHFVLESEGVSSVEGAKEFVASNQEEEVIYEAFLIGLIGQADFFPPDPDVWVSMAKKCNFDHPAILNDSIDLEEGGPISEWYIYPKLLRWLVQNGANENNLHLTDSDRPFLAYGMSLS